ncbi:outer membrane beta-barrel protein, partial [Streptomyces sp. CO7]
YRKSGQTYLATLYYRESSKGVTDVVTPIGGGAFLTTRENLNKSRSGGLELVANGRLTPKLTYNISGNVYWNEIDASHLGFTEKRDGFAVSGRGNLNWQVTPRDFIQFNGFMNGRRLTAQGHQDGFAMLNLGYRRKVNDNLSITVTAQDVLGTLED